jgi:putative intracellular protease/amidase
LHFCHPVSIFNGSVQTHTHKHTHTHTRFSSYAAKKIVAADCHGPIALAQCNKPDGTPLVKGLKCTGFTNSEEEAVQLTKAVPFLIETKFKEQGGLYELAPDWNPKATVCASLFLF